ncbi:ComF family protein, partial [Myxococcota bacterium]|nr:ComF family protein [Myxococcota bacterium]
MRRLFTGLATAVLPPACAACGAIGREPFCALCAEATEPAPPFSIEGADASAAVWLYGGPVATAIHHLKFHGRPELGPTLGRALCVHAAALGPFDAIVPVPLSRRRRVERGYNQARELVRPMRAPVLARALRRDDGAREQVGL